MRDLNVPGFMDYLIGPNRIVADLVDLPRGEWFSRL